MRTYAKLTLNVQGVTWPYVYPLPPRTLFSSLHTSFVDLCLLKDNINLWCAVGGIQRELRGTVRFKEMVTFTDIYSTHGRMATIRCDYSCKRICIKFSSLTRILSRAAHHSKYFIVYMYMHAYALNIGRKLK